MALNTVFGGKSASRLSNDQLSAGVLSTQAGQRRGNRMERTPDVYDVWNGSALQTPLFKHQRPFWLWVTSRTGAKTG